MPQKIVAFLNSTLGIWLLSAIFISGGIKLYEDNRARQKEKKDLTEAVSKLDLEIGYRYSKTLVRLFELTDKNPDSVALSKNFHEAEVKEGNDITGLEVFYNVQKVTFNDIQAVAISIEKHLILPRWKKNSFYFLDGNENNPFP